MIIFYVDEYGDHSMRIDEGNSGAPQLKKGVSEWFVLSAVGIRDSSRKPLAEALFEIKARHFGAGVALQPWGDSEIKGRFLFRAARSAAAGKTLASPAAYQVLDTPDKVTALIDDIGLLFLKYRPLIFSASVDKRVLLGRKKQEPPLGAAYTYLQQRVALTMEKLHAGEAAILVADQQTQHETFFRSGEMNIVRDRMTHPLPLKPNYNLVLDKPLWVDTELSTWDRELIQLSDIVAYSVAECLKRGEAPSEACYLWKALRQNFAAHWSTGDVWGGGLAMYPKPSHWPNA